MVQRVGGLGRKAAAVPDCGADAVGVYAGLYAKARQRVIKQRFVIKAALRQADEVGTGLGRGVRVKYGPDLAGAGIKHGDGIALGRAGKLPLCRFHGRTLDGFGAGHAVFASAARQQRQDQQRRQQPGQFFLHNTAPSQLYCNNRTCIV